MFFVNTTGDSSSKKANFNFLITSTFETLYFWKTSPIFEELSPVVFTNILVLRTQTACLKISKCSPGRVIKVYTILTRYIGASHKMPVRTKKNDPIMVVCEHKVSSNIGAILSKCNAILHSCTFYIFEKKTYSFEK